MRSPQDHVRCQEALRNLETVLEQFKAERKMEVGCMHDIGVCVCAWR